MNHQTVNNGPFPRQWTVFGIYPHSSTKPDARALADVPAGSCRRFGANPELEPAPEDMRRMPASLKLGGVERSPRTAEAPDGKLDLATVLRILSGTLIAISTSLLVEPSCRAGVGEKAAGDPTPMGVPVVMNGHQRPDLPLKTDDQGGWSFRYERDFRPDPAAWLAKDAPQTDMRWKGWEAPADAWRNGLYGGHLTYRLEFPHPVQSVTASAFVSNFADSQVGRRAFLEYSLDGTDWRPIAEAEYGVERKTLAGRAAIEQAGAYRLYVRLRQGAQDENARLGASVVFQEFSFAVSGKIVAPADAGHKAKVERLLEGRIPVGFYLYLYQWKAWGDPEARDLDAAIEEMARRGFTYLYTGGTGDGPLWTRVLALCEEHRIAVIPQLDFAYLLSNSDVDERIRQAVPFIKKYKDHPALMAFSVLEEPTEAIMPALKRYYEGILREVPDAPLHLLHNYIPQFRDMQPPYPGVMGTDRYGFWWEFSGQRATPWYALNWTQSQFDAYYQLAARRGADSQAVFTASTLEMFMTSDQIRDSIYGDAAKDRDATHRQILDLAAKKNQGVEQGPGDFYRIWKYYRPPVNCVRALSWLSIMEGARSISIWSWCPPAQDMIGFAHRTVKPTRSEYINSITGWDGRGTPQLEEYAEFAGQVQRYARLIRVMAKDCPEVDLAKPPAGHELVHSVSSQPVFQAACDNMVWRSFRVPGYVGRVVVVVNTGVGSWCEGRSPAYLSSTDVFRIDDYGNAVDYVPFTTPRELSGRVLLADARYLGGLTGIARCYDLRTGEALPATDDGTIALQLPPGGGCLLFLAPAGDEEWQRFRRGFGPL